MAENDPPMSPLSDDDFEDSRYFGNEGDGVQYATVGEQRHDEANVSESEGEAPGDTLAAPALSEKDKKKEQKRLEKELKEKEKKEKKLLKEQDLLIREEAKLQKSASVKKSGIKGEPSKITSKKPGVRPTDVVLSRVQLLDGTEYEFEISKKAKGQLLLDMVYEYVNLLEREFFSCYYIRDEKRFWLIADRKVSEQIGKLPWVFHFGVKFYAPDPVKITEDITRYQLCLQLRLDILSGRLACSMVTSALLGAFTVQAELGDYEPAEHGDDADYLIDMEFCPGQTPELINKIAQIHRTLRGQTPADAELNFLENVKKLELYGVELQTAKDAELVNITVGVSAVGIAIYRDQLRINRFPWPLVLKMAYKSDKFYVKIRPAPLEKYITTLVFKMPSHELAKRFWRLCIEHHSFFRLKQPMDLNRSFISSIGSSRHRFSGRTYYQSRVYASSIQRLAPYFERVSSQQLSMSHSLGNSFMDQSTRSARKKEVLREIDNNESRAKQNEQVSVVAGTSHETSRVAFIKTVRPDLEEHQVQHQYESKDGGADSSRRYQQHAASSADTSLNMSTELPGATQKLPGKKKKGKDLSVSVEYHSEKNGVPETRTEKRQVIGRADVDHDGELSKAIHSAMDMQADLSVDKIEIVPGDIAQSMVSSDQNQNIELETVKKKKKKTKKVDKPQAIPE